MCRHGCVYVLGVPAYQIMDRLSVSGRHVRSNSLCDGPETRSRRHAPHYVTHGSLVPSCGASIVEWGGLCRSMSWFVPYLLRAGTYDIAGVSVAVDGQCSSEIFSISLFKAESVGRLPGRHHLLPPSKASLPSLLWCCGRGRARCCSRPRLSKQRFLRLLSEVLNLGSSGGWGGTYSVRCSGGATAWW